jgi:hypothetical protein
MAKYNTDSRSKEKIYLEQKEDVGGPSSFSGSIDDIISELARMKVNGYEEIDYYRYDDSVEFISIKYRLETDEEYKKRQSDIYAAENNLKARKYADYLKLKKEFEGD